MDRGHVIPLRCEKCNGVYDLWKELVKRAEGKAITGDENFCAKCRTRELFNEGVELVIEVEMPEKQIND